MNHMLAAGASVPLPVPVVRAAVHWTTGGSGSAPDVDASALLLGAAGRVRSEEDFVFYNQPHHPSGLVRRLPKQREQSGFMDALEARLPGMDPSVLRLVLAVSTDGPPLATAGALQLTLWDTAGNSALAVLPLTAPSAADNALVCGELVRAPGGWEFHAVRRGFRHGLPELAAAYGIPAPATPPTPPMPMPITSATPVQPLAHVPARPQGSPTIVTPVPAPAHGAAARAALPAMPGVPAMPTSRPVVPSGGGTTGAVAYTYPQPDPGLVLPPQGPQFRTPPTSTHHPES